MNNEWLSTTFLTQTLVQGYPGADSSIFWVQSGATTLPTGNFAAPIQNKYSTIPTSSLIPASIFVTTVSASSPCYAPGPEGGNIKGNFSYSAVVKKAGGYSGSNAARRYWADQYSVWLAVNIDSALTDTTYTDDAVALQTFKTLADSSRYAYLSRIGDALSAGDTATARAQLAITPAMLCGHGLDTDATTGVRIADNCHGDTIVTHYKALYTAYMHHMTTGLTTSDTAQIIAIAQLCPLLNGGVVYQARAFYTGLYDDLRDWADTCPGDTSGAAKYLSPAQDNGATGLLQEQRYGLRPNPSDGNITLSQFVTDTVGVEAEVYDIVGRRVRKQELLFKDGASKMNIQDVAPGMYLLQLVDSKNKIFMFKFVISK